VMLSNGWENEFRIGLPQKNKNKATFRLTCFEC
jgi:hypothetical protein